MRQTTSSGGAGLPQIEPLEPRLLLSAASGGVSWELLTGALASFATDPLTAGVHAGAPAAEWAVQKNAADFLPLAQATGVPASALAEKPIRRIQWNGQTCYAHEGEWIVRIDGVNALLASQATLAAAPVAGPTTSLSCSGPQYCLSVGDVKLHGTSLNDDVSLLEVPGSLSIEQVEQAFEGIEGFRYAEPNFYVYVEDNIPDDPMFDQLWGLHNTGQDGGTADADIDAPGAWETHTGTGNVVVAVIDTGVDYNHPDLAENMWRNPGEVPGDGVDNDLNGLIDDIYGYNFVDYTNDPLDDYFHGTHCAGTIAAVGNNGLGVVGVNWNAQIMALKFLDEGGGGYTFDAVSALGYATMMRRDFGVNVVLTSNSWGGGGYSQALEDAIRESGEAGMLFIAAAGNESSNNDLGDHYPSNYALDNVIAVAATDRNDKLASFSSYGPTTVDLGAPGVSILSTFPTYMTGAMQSRGFPTDYAVISGTSMATPHVAGVAALLCDFARTLTYQEVRDTLFAGVDPLPALTGITVTGGRLNAAKSLVYGAGPYLVLAGHGVDDDTLAGTSGNDDGIINPGELVGLDLTVRNVGLEDAANVTATLSLATPSPYVTILQDTVAVGFIPSLGQAAAGQFLIRIDGAAPIPHPLDFQVTFRDSGGDTWLAPLREAVHSSSTIAGTVRLDGQPLAGAEIRYIGPAYGTIYSQPDGSYSFAGIEGTYSIAASKGDFLPSDTVAVTVPGDRLDIDFAFTTVTVSGTVTDTEGLHIAGATIAYWGDMQGEAVSGIGGAYSFTRVVGRTAKLKVQASRKDFLDSPITDILLPPSMAGLDFSLYPLEYYEIARIGDLPEFGIYGDVTGVYPESINDQGQVVGYVNIDLGPEGGLRLPFLWDNGVTTDLNQGQAGRAYDINDLGQVCGTIDGAAVIWEPDGSRRIIGYFSDWSYTAAAINNVGQVCGKGREDCYFWDDGTFKFFHLEEIYGTNIMNACDLNDLGQVVGYVDKNIGGGWGAWERAYLWEDYQITELGTLGGPSSMAFAINNSTQITGTSHVGFYMPRIAFLWEDGQMYDLGALGHLDKDSGGADINDRGIIIGSVESEGGMIYRYGTMHRLDDLIDPDSGWHNISPVAINNLGQICGLATDPDGHQTAVLLTPSALAISNHEPVARDATVATIMGSSRPITLHALDIDEDDLDYLVVEQPQHGTLEPGREPNEIIYTPDDNFEGLDSFRFRASDGTLDSQPALVQVFVSRGYEITDLGSLPGTNACKPYAINDRGQIVGDSWGGFQWEDGQITELNLNYLGGWAKDINAGSQIVGHAFQAFLYQQGVKTLLGTFGGRSYAEGINDLGQIVGWSGAAGLYDFHAILWDQGQMQDMGTLGGQHAWAYDINNSGIAVGRSDNGLQEHAFVYELGHMTDIGTLGGDWSEARAINEQGLVVGAARREYGYALGFLYDGQAMQSLGTLGGLNSEALGINDHGLVVGTSEIFRRTDLNEPINHAFVWHGLFAAEQEAPWEHGVIVDLNDLVIDRGDWELNVACDINNNGQIVGYGANSMGTVRGFLLTPVNGAVPPASVLEHAVNGGDAYRSNLESFSVRFSGDVSASLDPDDVALYNETEHAAVPMGAAHVEYDHATNTATWVLDGVPIVDGNYTVTVKSVGIFDANSVRLDGDGDGLPGGDYDFTSFRLQGDANGDRQVNIFDAFALNAAWGAAVGNPRYLPGADLNSDGLVSIFDAFLMNSSWGHALAEPAALAADTLADAAARTPVLEGEPLLVLDAQAPDAAAPQQPSDASPAEAGPTAAAGRLDAPPATTTAAPPAQPQAPPAPIAPAADATAPVGASAATPEADLQEGLSADVRVEPWPGEPLPGGPEAAGEPTERIADHQERDPAPPPIGNIVTTPSVAPPVPAALTGAVPPPAGEEASGEISLAAPLLNPLETQSLDPLDG